MRQIKLTMRRLAWRVIGAGISQREDLEVIRKVVLVSIMTLTASVSLAVFGTIALLDHNYVLAAVEFSLLGVLVTLYILLRTTQKVDLLSKIGVGIVWVFLLYLTALSPVGDSAFVWLYAFPLIALFLLGPRAGSLAAISLYVPVLTAMIAGTDVQWLTDNGLTITLRFAISYVIIVIFCLVTELSRIAAYVRLRSSNETLAKTVQELEKAKKQLTHLATVDTLTGLSNRRLLETVVPDILAQAARDGGTVAIMMVDIDRFKDFNDEYGHLEGDEALRVVADVLRSALRRRTDRVFRYGGEEFTVLLTNTTAEMARRIAESIRVGLTARNIPHAHGINGRLTLSAGVVVFNPRCNHDATTQIDRADQALYRAKDAGRDRIVVDDQQL